MVKMLRLIFTLSLFAFCVGAPECSSDPCRDLWTAKRCDKVKHCISEDWSKLKPTGNTDNVCDICLRMVKEARDTLESNETREQLLEVFEGSCRLLFLKPAVELCDKVVDQLVPELVEILSSQMDPETVCTVAKLCNNEAFRVAQKNSKDCVYCETLTDIASKKINSLSSEQFKNQVLDVCRSAGGYSDACYQIASKFSDQLYSSAHSILEKKPCELTLLCPSGSVHSHSAHKSNKRACSLCMNTMMSLRKQLLNVKSPEEFVENTAEICGKVGYSNSTCSKVANLAFYEKLSKSDALPPLFCRTTFCRPAGTSEEVPVWPLVPAGNEGFGSVPDFDAVEFVETLEMFFPDTKQKEIEITPRPTISYGDPIGSPIFFSPSVGIAEFGDCKTCTDVFDILSESEKVDDGYLKGSVESICEKSGNFEMCQQFIKNFSPVLTAAFAEGPASKKMCEDMVPFCKVKENELKTESNCDFCLNAVKILKRDDTAAWNKVLEEKCSSLSENTKEVCMSIFGNILALVKNSNEDEICSYVKLCDAKVNETDVQAMSLDKSSCHICIDTLQTITNFLKNKNSEMVIRIFLESVCFMLPPAEHAMCSHLIDVIGIDQLKKFLENIKPREACVDMHICRKFEESKPSVLTSLPSEKTEVRKVEKVPCKFCLMAMKMLIDQLQDDKTEDSIRKALDGLCKYFPEETRDTCRSLIDEYTEDLIDMIIADFNATEICTFLKICPGHHLLGHKDEKPITLFDLETNEIRDGDEKAKQSAVDSYLKKSQASVDKAFEKLQKIVQECALCEALVGVISSHKKMLSKDFSFPANAELICSIVPADKKRECMSMIVSYGPSIVNLIVDHKANLDDVCVRVDLCDAKLEAKVNQPVSLSEEKFLSITENECLLGPLYWCANAENAEKCGTFLHCQETVWKNWKNPPIRPYF